MKRLYEFRYTDTGERNGPQMLCENACEFWLRAWDKFLTRQGVVHYTSGEGVTGRTLAVHVSSTGERVVIEGEIGVRARLWNEPLTGWVKRR